ncbi:hypothetical protein Desaci_4121 [Desulfosporosinus acidiphilus SJ4]|uniref:Uncharacterized protein n=1 Tax=Desulfosporosinus acidiphilus (strain DSM 22704 / JCM 16185 / SJ4) TaxID=646529 RepID=I4DB09_DESAJ|nr:hypothetical protein [Desulfosporosinus acidiphilus]AFM42983.1 hypothetical protein Desaci_4121 [Desulfosporosinus acidiphilus SJ4]
MGDKKPIEETLKGLLDTAIARMEKIGGQGPKAEIANIREINKIREMYMELVRFWGMEEGWIASFNEIDEAFGLK